MARQRASAARSSASARGPCPRTNEQRAAPSQARRRPAFLSAGGRTPAGIVRRGSLVAPIDPRLERRAHAGIRLAIVGQQRLAVHDANRCAQRPGGRLRPVQRRGNGSPRLLPGCLDRAVAVLGEVAARETFPRQAAQRVVVAHAVAGLPIVLGQQRSDARVVGQVAEGPLEPRPRLIDRHVREQIAVVAAGGIAVEQVGDREQGPRCAVQAENPLFCLPRKPDEPLARELRLGHRIDGPLVVGYDEQAAFGVGREGLLGFDLLLDEGVGQGLAVAVSRIELQPVAVAEEAVEEHRLRFRVGHRCRRELLAEARRVLRDVREMRRMPALVEQRVQTRIAAADLVGVGVAGEVDDRRHPGRVAVPGRPRRMHESVLVFALAVEQIERELRVAKLHAHAAERFDPAPQAVPERQIRIEPLRRGAAHEVLEVVCGQGRLAVARDQLLEAAALRLAGSSLEPIEHSEQGLGRHPLLEVDLVIEVVAVTLGAGERIAPLDHVGEAVADDPPLELQQRPVGGFPDPLVVGGHEVRRQHEG